MKKEVLMLEVEKRECRPAPRALPRIAALACLALAAACLGGPSALARSHAAVKNIVLVHGAFADASSWSKIVPLLEAKGFRVTAVGNPLTSFADDVAATK